MSGFTFENTIPAHSPNRQEAEKLWREICEGKKDGMPSIAYIVARLLGRRNTENTFMKALREWHNYAVE